MSPSNSQKILLYHCLQCHKGDSQGRLCMAVLMAGSLCQLHFLRLLVPLEGRSNQKLLSSHLHHCRTQLKPKTKNIHLYNNQLQIIRSIQLKVGTMWHRGFIFQTITPHSLPFFFKCLWYSFYILVIVLSYLVCAVFVESFLPLYVSSLDCYDISFMISPS